MRPAVVEGVALIGGTHRGTHRGTGVRERRLPGIRERSVKGLSHLGLAVTLVVAINKPILVWSAKPLDLPGIAILVMAVRVWSEPLAEVFVRRLHAIAMPVLVGNIIQVVIVSIGESDLLERPFLHTILELDTGRLLLFLRLFLRRTQPAEAWAGEGKCESRYYSNLLDSHEILLMRLSLRQPCTTRAYGYISLGADALGKRCTTPGPHSEATLIPLIYC